MLYRKLPTSPPRLLLRIVVTAGTGALLGIAACGSDSSVGTVVSLGPDATDTPPTGDDGSAVTGIVVGMPTGLLPNVPDAGDAADATLGMPMGLIVGLVPRGDAGGDAARSQDYDAGTSDGASRDAADEEGLHCPPICGLVGP
jgi:hypothetical protein